jgi:hypothetical protein
MKRKTESKLHHDDTSDGSRAMNHQAEGVSKP